MAYVITDACKKDFVCADQCATAAIAPIPGQSAAGTVDHLFINPDECIDCGNCAAVCDSGAIFAEADLPADKAHFADKNRAFFN